MNRLALVTSAAVIALLATGCMSGSSDRSARKAALGSTTSGEVIGTMTIAGVGSSIDLYGFSWGVAGQGNVNVDSVNVIKKVDGVSSNLVRAVFTGQVFSNVTIQLMPVGGRPYATYELASAVVQRVEHSAGDGEEHVALASGGCLSFSPSGGTRTGWNSSTGRTC